MAGLVHPRQIRAGRALLGWTQSDLGRAMGIDQRIIRFHERRLPSNPRKLVALERAFSDHGVEVFDTPTIGVRLMANAKSPE